jgi:ribosomal protein L40E
MRSVVDGTCPKCGAEQQADDPACRKCGLSAERMAAFAAVRDGSVPEALTAAWERVVERWDDPSAHDELIRLVTQNSAYAWAAAKYRDRDDDVGKAQLERVRKAAEVTMMSTAAVRPDLKAASPYRSVAMLLAILVALAVAGLIYAMAIRDRHPAATPPTPNSTPTTTPTPSGLR